MNSVEIIKKSWSFYKLHFKRLWPLFLLGSGGGFGIYSLLPETNNLADYVDIFSTPVILIIVAIFSAVSVFLFISHITLIKTISNTFKKHIQNSEDSYKVGQELFISALVVTVIYDLCVQGATLLLIIPGIIVGGYLIFYLMEFVDQNKRGMDALLSSWAIVDGRWWEVFWKVLVTGVMIIFPFLIISAAIVLSGMVLFSALGMGGATPLILGTIFGIIVFLLVVLLIIPLNIIALFEIYYYFRNSRENKRNERTDKNRVIIIKILAIIGLLYLLFELLNRFIGQ